MKWLGTISAILLSGVALYPAAAQDTLAVSSADLMAHVEKRAPLIYPAIPMAARVTGTVVVQIDVNAKGIVTATKVISGPLMLQQAAIDSLKQWKFKPFEKDGAPVAAQGPVSVIFSLGESQGAGQEGTSTTGTATETVEVRAEGVPVDAVEEAIAQRYFQQFGICMTALHAGKHDEEAVAACRRAADTAAEFAPDRRFIEKRSANVYAATVLADAGDYVPALIYANKAVAIVELGHDDNSGSSAAYFTRGMIEASVNNWTAADADLKTGEDFQRKGIAWAERQKSALATNYRRTLARELRSHASVLQHMNRPAEAQAKLAEAAKLN